MPEVKWPAIWCPFCKKRTTCKGIASSWKMVCQECKGRFDPSHHKEPKKGGSRESR